MIMKDKDNNKYNIIAQECKGVMHGIEKTIINKIENINIA